jgi:pSer/pThr/pTyr-binding forkhead associated (FHA) protein
MKKLSSEAFLDACGGRGPFYLDVTPFDGYAPLRQVLTQPFVLIGRHPRADVCLKDPEVSRRHAFVQMVAGHFFCVDLGSRTGTHWAAGPRSRGWLPNHAPLRVGAYQLAVADTSPGIGLPITATPDGWDPWSKGSLARYALPTITLSILNDGKKVCRWRMNRVLAVVGSASSCKVCLRGPGVQGYHCGLVCTPAGVWVIDLQRHGGVQLNDIPVAYALLEDGDQLQLGSYTIHVNYSPAVPSTGENPCTNLLSSRVGNEGTIADLVATPVGDANGLIPWPNAGPADPSAIRTRESSDELVPDLLRQFGELQRQMFDQSMHMMFQMFQTMHGEHVGVLREEMDRLGDLNHQLQTLVADRLQSAPAPIPEPPPPPRESSPLAPATPVEPEPAANSAVPRPAPEPAPPTSVAPPQAAAMPLPPRPAAPANNGRAAPATPAPGQDVHVWLYERMNAIQNERQGLWTKILGVLKKKE